MQVGQKPIETMFLEFLGASMQGAEMRECPKDL